MFKRCVAGLLAAIGSTTVGVMMAAPMPAEGAKWRHYQSPNFELYSSAADAESRAMLHNLELLRTVFFDRFRLTERTRLDVTAFLFGKPNDFAAYGPPGANAPIGAYYLAHPDRAIIVVGPTAEEEINFGSYTVFHTSGQHLIFHEYVHHLFRATNQTPTLWFNEGVAELLATLQVHRDHLELGHANPPNLIVLQNYPLMPLAEILAAENTAQGYSAHAQGRMFYPESWALLHYLHFGESGLPKEGIAKFVKVMGDQKLAARVDTAKFFRECFGIDYAEMQERLDKYVTKGKYRPFNVPLPQLPPSQTYPAREVAPPEIHLRLAELAVRVQGSGAGKLALLEADPSSDVRIDEVLGTVSLMENDLKGAHEHWDRALELGSRNGAVLREVARSEMADWLSHLSFELRLPPATVQRLRQRLLQSIAADPAQSSGYEVLAMVEAFAPEPALENARLVETHFRQLQNRTWTLVALAMVRVRLKQLPEAKLILDRLDQLQPEPPVAHFAGILRERIPENTRAAMPAVPRAR